MSASLRAIGMRPLMLISIDPLYFVIAKNRKSIRPWEAASTQPKPETISKISVASHRATFLRRALGNTFGNRLSLRQNDASTTGQAETRFSRNKYLLRKQTKYCKTYGVLPDITETAGKQTREIDEFTVV